MQFPQCGSFRVFLIVLERYGAAISNIRTRYKEVNMDDYREKTMTLISKLAVKGFQLSFVGLAACSSAVDDSQPVDTETTTYEQATETVTSDTAPELVLPEAGTWDMSEKQVVSDSCGIGDYQDVLEFEPSEIEISNVTEAGFNLDDNVYCDLSDSIFSCTTQLLEESTMGGTATMMIDSTMSGIVEDSNLISTEMSVVITSCEGAGCLLVELALTFPCPIDLEATAAKF